MEYKIYTNIDIQTVFLKFNLYAVYKYVFFLRKCIKSSSTSQIVFLTCFSRLISSLPPFTALAFISFWSLLLLHFAHHKCTHNAHTRTTLTTHTHTPHTLHTHTTNTTRASCLIHNLCQKHIGAPIRSTGNATIFIYTHMCVCVRRHSFGHRA